MEFTIATLMRDITTVFQNCMYMINDIHNVVVANPLLLLPVIIGLCGIGIGFFNRLKQ